MLALENNIIDVINNAEPDVVSTFEEHLLGKLMYLL